MALARELFDVITPEDPRAPDWPELADVAIVRTGHVSEAEVRRAKKLKIVTRNGWVISSTRGGKEGKLTWVGVV